MSNPQGPERRWSDDAADVEQTGELPAWGQQPPGGWGSAESADRTSTGGWAPDRNPGWEDRGSTDAGWDPDTAARDARRDAGWGADPAATGGWNPEQTGGWNAEQTGGWNTRDTGGWEAPAAGGATRSAPLWGDDATGPDDGWAVPAGRRARRHAADDDPGATAAVPAESPRSRWGAEPADPSGGQGGEWEPGEEPWAPRENVRSPRTGPFGLGLRTWGLIAAGVVVVAAVLVTAFLIPGWALTPTMDRTALQNGVNKVLSQDYGLQVGAVQCPDEVAVEVGAEFRCQALVDGEQVEVPGVITSEQGDYQVKRV